MIRGLFPGGQMLIGLHGLPRSGKDTIADLLVRAHGFTRVAFADPLKQAAALLLNRSLNEAHGIGYDREQVMPEWGFSMRWFLQKFGTEGIRDTIAKDFWIKRAALEIAKYPRVVMTDVRFPNEANMIAELGGVMVEVRRPGTTGSAHASDQLLACDAVVANDGSIDDLHRQVNTLLRRI